MRRSLPRAVTVLGLLVVLSGAASAATVRGTSGPDRLVGTPRPDTVLGLGGADRLNGRAGPDFLDGGPGADTLTAGRGDDRVVAQSDGSRDTVACGPGRDIVTADIGDRVARDCETVSRQLSRDLDRSSDSHHETQVEPDSFAFGSTIVTTFQSGRYFDGGASNIGFATSRDGGRTWTSGFLPAVTAHSTPVGRTTRASDPVVAYDATHGVWLIATLGVTPAAATQLFISRSSDGVTWSPPVVAAETVSPALAYDKEWIACDNWPTSPFRGRCYLTYSDLARRSLSTQSSSDGGLTWSAPARGPGLPAVGVIPLPQPDGSLTIVYLGADDISATRSTDGGASFSARLLVAEVTDRDVPVMRAPPLPSAEVDGSGRMFVAWQDCRFRPACGSNDIVVSSSADGVSWSAPTRVPIDPVASAATHFVPGLAADPGSGGTGTRLAIAYHSLPAASCDSDCRVDIGLIASSDGGASWGRPQRLSAQAMPVSWIPPTSSGRMLADYISTSFAGGRAVPVFALAAAPLVRGRFRQAIFATPPR